MRTDSRVGDADEVDILLSVCDGGAFLDAQLESLAAQTHARWRLYVRDDQSSDDSPRVLERFASQSDRPVVISTGPREKMGPSASYGVLMDAAPGSHVMFCDQDDVWDRDKIACSLAAMRSLEERFGADVPLLVHSDLRVVDRDLRPLEGSLWRYMGLDPNAAQRFERVLIHNVVTGCAMLANRPLVSLASPIPASAVMHDWWLALVAAAFGHIAAIERATLCYRQHAGNAAGARRFGIIEILDSARRPFDRRQLLENTAATSAQARAFLERFDSRMNERQRKAAHALACLLDKGFLGRRASIVRNGLYKVGCVRNLATLLRI